MNAKKISALVLAAVMAAGTTTVAFARANEDYPLDIPDRQWENVYVEKDGVLKEVQKGDIVTPGTTLYIRLDEYSKAETKDKNKSKVWAEWKVGKDMVEDVDIVYKKGEFYTNIWSTDYTFTVDGVDFTVKASDVKSLQDLKNEMYNELADYQKDHPEFLKDEIWKEVRSYYGTGSWTDASGVAYEDMEAALRGAGYTETAKDVYSMSGWDIAYRNADVVDFLTEAGFEVVGSDDIYLTGADNRVGYGIGVETADTTHTVNIANHSNYMALKKGNQYLVVKTDTITQLTSLAGWNDLGMIEAKGWKDNKGGIFANIDAAGDAAEKAGDIKAPEKGLILPGASVPATNTDAWDTAVRNVLSAEVDKAAKWDGHDVAFDTEYTYWVAIDTKDDDTTALLDLAGSIYVGTTKSKAYDENAYDLDFTFSNRVDDYSDADVVEDEYTFKPDSRAVVKFAKDAEDVTLYFGSEEDIWYEFDARGQSALNFAFTFDYNREIAADYPEANIDFITWTAQPSTNRTGTLYITADPDSFIYEISEDGKTLKEVANAEYNEDEEAWEIRTRKLVGYAISDKELDLVEDTTSSSTGSETGSNNGGKDNPDTGR